MLATTALVADNIMEERCSTQRAGIAGFDHVAENQTEVGVRGCNDSLR